MTPLQQSIIDTLKSWEGYWYSYEALLDFVIEDGHKTPIPQLRKEMKELCDMGFVEVRATFDDDTGLVNGSGWFIVTTQLSR